MKLSIRQLQRDRSADLKGELDATRFPPVQGDLVEVAGKVAAELTAVMQFGITTVQGTIRFPIKAACSRCLEPVRQLLTVPFREQFASSEESVPKEDRDEVHLNAEDTITLDPYVEEAVWLALPLAPVCSEDCRGLCAQCGINLNRETCACNKDKIDPRLAGLADFFELS